MEKPSLEIVEVCGVRTFCRSAAPANSGDADPGEAIVFVHGNPGSSEDWADLLPLAGRLCRAFAPDMPGFGASDRPEKFAYTLAGYATHLEALFEKLGVRRAHLVLHDLGGFWGLSWAARHPEKVASLALLDVGVMPGFRWHKFARIWRTPILGELFQLSTTRSGLRWLLDADNPRPFPRGFVDRMYDHYDQGLKRAVLKFYRATSDLDGMAETFASALGPRHLPALVIWGADDKYSPARFAEAQRAVFDAEVHVLPSCGHWPMIDEPQKVSSLLLPFLRKQLLEVRSPSDSNITTCSRGPG